MKIIVNNQPLDIAEGSSIADILDGKPSEGIATALNGIYVNREARQNTLLQEGDEVVIISAAYGG